MNVSPKAPTSEKPRRLMQAPLRCYRQNAAALERNAADVLLSMQSDSPLAPSLRGPWRARGGEIRPGWTERDSGSSCRGGVRGAALTPLTPHRSPIRVSLATQEPPANRRSARIHTLDSSREYPARSPR